MRSSILITLILVGFSLKAQELNCDVKVSVPKAQIADPTVFRDLETAIREFMNNRKWTNDTYEPGEKINCQFVISISKENSMDDFEAEVSIVSSRPVYNSDYETVMFNHLDKDWRFRYAVSQPLEFNESAHLNNLTSLLAYYAYIIIGLDYDSYARYGGQPWFQKAQIIVNNAQNAPEKGWAVAGQRNRYWLVENLLSPKFTGFRNAFYTYHLKAMDEFYTNAPNAARTVIGVLGDLDGVNKANPTSMILQVFFNAKKQELMDIFAGAPPAERVKASNFLCSLDPARCEAYKKAIG